MKTLERLGWLGVIGALIVLLISVSSVYADMYRFYDPFNAGFADSGNWSHQPIKSGGYSFENGKINLSVYGSSGLAFNNDYLGANKIIRRLPSTLNWSWFNVTVGLNGTFSSIEQGITIRSNFTNASGTYNLPVYFCGTGRTTESYENIVIHSKTGLQLYAEEDYPSAYGDSGAGENWDQHYLRVEFKKMDNDSIRTTCFYSGNEDGDYMGNVWYQVEVPKFLPHDFIYDQNLSYGIETRFSSAGDSNRRDSMFYFVNMTANGTFYEPPPPPTFDLTVSLVSPANMSIINYGTTSLTYSVNQSASCLLYLNEKYNATITGTGTQAFSKYLPVGNHSWNINCSNSTYTGKTGTFNLSATVFTDDVFINLTTPLNYSVLGYDDVDLTYYANGSVSCRLQLNNTVNQTMVASSGSNVFSLVDLGNFSTFWQVNCTNASTTNSISQKWFFKVYINTTNPITYNPEFSYNKCPMDSVQQVLLLALFLIIGLFFITWGFMSNNAIIGILGSVVLLVISFFIIPCSSLMGLTVTLIGGMVMLKFAVFGRWF